MIFRSEFFHRFPVGAELRKAYMERLNLRILLLLLLSLLFCFPASAAPAGRKPDAVISVGEEVSPAPAAAPAAAPAPESPAAPAGRKPDAVISVSDDVPPASGPEKTAAPAAKSGPQAAVVPVSTSGIRSLEVPVVIDRITFPDAYPDFSFPADADLLDIWFPCIRDQDCAVFRYQDQIWMLDCGDTRAQDEIVPLLRFLGISRIHRLLNTHPHHDHLNGLYAVAEAVHLDELSICFPEDQTVHMTAAMEYCKGYGIPVTTFQDESVLGMGDGFVSFLAWQKSTVDSSLNDRSAQFMVSYGSCRILFMADLEYQGQKQLWEALSPEDLKADILRYPHHGKSKMIDPLFAAIDPDLTIITNTTRIYEIGESTLFLSYKHKNVAYTHCPPWVIHLQTDGVHWLCDRLAMEQDIE